MQYVELVGCNRTIPAEMVRCLKSKTAQELLDQLWNIPSLGFLEFPLVIVSRDRNFFRQHDAFNALRKREFRRDVNLMIGINHDEGNFW